MKRKALIALIISSCVVVVGCVGLVFWAFAATQVNVNSKLSVTYTPELHVVCEASATYQKKTDESETPFISGSLDLVYGGTITSTTLEASSSALNLDDTDTYVIFEFTFKNKNLMETYDLYVTLTDNAVCNNMTRKYYFGNISATDLETKKTTIIDEGVENAELTSQSLTLGYNETGKVYMLLEISVGYVATYTTNEANSFIFSLTAQEHSEIKKVSYLSSTWKDSIGYSDYKDVVEKITFTSDSSLISGLTNSVSVGTINETSTEVYVENEWVEDVKAYWGDNKSNIVIYSPCTIYAPESSYLLFGLYRESVNSLNTLILDNFDTSKVTDMGSMFYCCSKLVNLDISNFETANVTDMALMFSLCSSVTDLNVSNFNTSKVTRMDEMFNGCSSITSLDVRNFDTKNVLVMTAMFSSCRNLISLDVSNFDTSNVIDMASMFSHLKSMDSLDLSSFDTSKVTTMQYMFIDSSSLESLNLSSFNTNKVTEMEYIFSGCTSLTSLDLSNFNTSQLASMQYMFNECSNLASLNLTSFNSSNVTNMAYTFYGCSALQNLNLGNFNFSKCTNFNKTLTGCSALASITLPYNLQSGKTISLPASTYYNGSAGPYSTIGRATSGTTVACSTASSKVTLTKH